MFVWIYLLYLYIICNQYVSITKVWLEYHHVFFQVSHSYVYVGTAENVDM
jgi:hypothetical protein